MLQSLPGVFAGDTLNFTFSASLEGLGDTIANLILTALPSPVMAVLDGPSGDVLVRQGGAGCGGGGG